MSERFADNVVHVVGVSAGLIAVPSLIIAAAIYLPAASTASLSVYGGAMLAMLGFSAAYHMVPAGVWKRALRRLDHAAIFVKIAATYTPFAAIKMRWPEGAVLLGSVWGVAVLGAAGKLFLATTWDKLAIPLYLALGWAGLVFGQSVAASLGMTALALLGAGGILYTVGVIFHVWRSLPYQNAVWHGFVLAGTGCHFGAVTAAAFA
ncbi:MAG: hemolysin III family protein [Hyphomicrobiaceae bacterium]|nr:MAG: hemolysin III family protein [Hyphomicrobiaceae bacterium]